MVRSLYAPWSLVADGMSVHADFPLKRETGQHGMRNAGSGARCDDNF
jgi:hypothetical protein